MSTALETHPGGRKSVREAQERKPDPLSPEGCTAAAGGTSHQASRLQSEFRFCFLGFLSQSLVGPSPDPRRLLGELLIQVRVPTQTLPADKRRSWAIRTTAWTPLRRRHQI